VSRSCVTTLKPVDTSSSPITTMREDGPVPAYRALYRGGSQRLIGLGPAFFTKVLYFACWDRAAGERRPLILDQFVVIALNDQADLGWKLNWAWSADQYATYLDHAHDWAIGWGKGTTPDVVERVLFERGKELSKKSRCRGEQPRSVQALGARGLRAPGRGGL
jgi:hypothetical protein